MFDRLLLAVSGRSGDKLLTGSYGPEADTTLSA